LLFAETACNLRATIICEDDRPFRITLEHHGNFHLTKTFMEWYYAQNNQQKGPVSEVELAGLITSGVVNDQTLTWHEGMANWQTYGEVRMGLITPSAPSLQSQPEATLGADQSLCAECGRVFPKDQTIQFGTAWVCAECKPRYIQKVKEGVAGEAPGTMQFAGFWIRFAAKFIDWLALGIVLGIPMVALMFGRISKMQSPNPNPFEFLGVQLLIQFITIVGTVAYNTFFIGRYGATLGKLAVGIKVVTAEGARPTYMRAFGRAWAEQLSQLVCYIGYIIAGFDDQRRAMHDHICSTRVVLK
jgi:uncharacterized RDD family membrane protein YckC